MVYTNQEIEERLTEMLHEMLRDHNQEDSIISLVYNEETNDCVIKMTVNVVEDDDYIGFGCY